MENKTIILSRTDSIGDVVLTLPAAGILKKQFPSCRIIFLGRTYTRPIIECCAHVDMFADWDEVRKMSPQQQLEFFRGLRADVIVHVFPNKQVAKLARRAGIKERIGTSHRFFHWFTCNRRVNFTRRRSDLHEAQLNLKLLAPIGMTRQFTLGELAGFYGLVTIKPLPDGLRTLVRSDRFNLILHPRSKGSAREWGLDNFSALIERLPPEKFNLFVTGTKEDGNSMRDFLARHKTVTDLTGKLSLDELVSFIHTCNGLVAASTGPLHVAAALGKRLLVFMLPCGPFTPAVGRL